jgi:hypothetical protein
MRIESKDQDHQHLLHGYSSRARKIATLPKLNPSSTCRVKITELQTMVAATKETTENHCKMFMTAFLANGRRLGMNTISKKLGKLLQNTSRVQTLGKFAKQQLPLE